MGTWISNGGKWYPAKEEVGLINNSGHDITVNGKVIKAGKPFIYEGADRSALYQLWEEAGKPTDPEKAITYLGQNFKDDPDFIMNIRQKYGMTVEEYLKMIGFDEIKASKEFEERMVSLKAHEVVERAKEVDVMGGGVETGTGKVIERGAIGDVSLPAGFAR